MSLLVYLIWRSINSRKKVFIDRKQETTVVVHVNEQPNSCDSLYAISHFGFHFACDGEGPAIEME